jgi:hypothetical protein
LEFIVQNQYTRYIVTALVPGRLYWGAGDSPANAARRCLAQMSPRDRGRRRNVRYSLTEFVADSAFSTHGQSGPPTQPACWVDNEYTVSRHCCRERLPDDQALAAICEARVAEAIPS